MEWVVFGGAVGLGGVLGRRWGGRAGLRLGWWGFTWSEDSHYFIDDGSDVLLVLVF